MGKFLFWIVIGLLAWLLVKIIATKARPARPPATREAPSLPMVKCDRCGMHLPASEALSARGKHYCSAAHRDGDG